MTRQNLDLTPRLTWEETKMEDLFFEPQEERNTLRGIETGYKTIFREHSDGKVGIISTMSNDYDLIPNTTLHEMITDYEGMELELNKKMSGCRKNKKTHLVYNIKTDRNMGSDDSDGDLMPRLVVKNSYDGSTEIEFEIGFFRFICSNGLIIPIEGKVMKFKKKHRGIDNDLQMQIHQFLGNALNDTLFDSVRDKVIAAKQKKETRIDYSMLKQMPYNQLFPVVYGVHKFSEIDVFVVADKGQRQYYLNNLTQAKELIARIVFERTNDEEKTAKLTTQKWEKASELKYEESINNHWQVFNLIVKILQYKVAQNRRLQVASEIARRML